MSAVPVKKTALTVGAALVAAFGVGCGSNPPCEIDISTVDSARSSAKSAEAKLEDAEAQKAQLEKQIQEENARQSELENRKRKLMAQIDELGG